MEALPLEILYEILVRLPPTSFLRMKQLNRFFRDLYNDEFLWQQACQYISNIPSVSYWKRRYREDDVYWKGRVLEHHPSNPGPTGDYPETTWREIFHHIRDGHLSLVPILLQDKSIRSLWISSSSNVNNIISRICSVVFIHYPELADDTFKLAFKHSHRDSNRDILIIIHNGEPFERLYPTSTLVYHLDRVEVILYDWQPMVGH